MKKYLLLLILSFEFIAAYAQCPAGDNPRSACSGVPFTFNAATLGFAAATTFTWTAPSGTGFNGGAANAAASGTVNGTLTLTGAGAATATYVVDPSCGAGTFNLVVTVNPIPSPPVLVSAPAVCVGSNLVLTVAAVAGASFNWTGPGGFSLLASTNVLTRINAQATMGGNYSVTKTVDGCPSTALTVPAVVNAIPSAPTLVSAPAVCVGSNLVITVAAVAGATYNWTGPGGFTLPASTNVLTRNNAQLTMSGNYSVTMTVGGCTSTALAVNGVVNPVPSPPTLVSAPEVCAGTNLVLTVTAEAGATFNWSGPGGFTLPASTNVLTRISAQPSMSGSYSVTKTVNGCTSTALAIPSVVNPIPSPPTLVSAPNVCAGSNLVITVTAVAGATFNWTGPNGFSLPASTNVLTRGAASANMAGNYSVTQTLDGCTSTATTISNVVVRATPTLGGITTVQTCAGSGATIAMTGLLFGQTFTVNYTINAVANSSTVTADGAGNGSFTTPTTVTNGQSLIITSLAYTNSPSCSQSFSNQVTLSIRPIPTLGLLVGTQTPICQGGTSAITLNNLIAGSNVTVNYTITGQAPVSKPVTLAGNTGTFITDAINTNGALTITINSLTYSSGTVCSASFAISAPIVVIQGPSISSVNSISICQGTTTPQTICLNGSNLNASTVSMFWTGTPPSGLSEPTPGTVSGNCFNVTLNSTAAPGNYSIDSIRVTASGAPGCSSRFTAPVGGLLLLTIKPNPIITSVTSPLNHQSLCPGTFIQQVPVDITTSSDPNPSFSINWSIDNNIGFGTFQNNVTSTGAPILIPGTTTVPANTIVTTNEELSVTAIVQGCSTTVAAHALYDIFAAPVFGLTNGFQVPCNDSTTASICINPNSSPNGTTFSYTINSSIGLPLSGVVNPCVPAFQVDNASAAEINATITITGKTVLPAPNGCSTSHTATIIAKPTPKASFAGPGTASTTICSGESVTTTLGYNVQIATVVQGQYFLFNTNGDVEGTGTFNFSGTPPTIIVPSNQLLNPGTQNRILQLQVVIKTNSCEGDTDLIRTITIRPLPTLDIVTPLAELTKCNDNLITASFASNPSDVQIFINQTGGTAIGFGTPPHDTIINAGDPFSFNTSNATDLVASGTFTATAHLACASGDQVSSAETWTFNVNPGPAITKKRVVNTSIVDFEEDSIVFCSNSVIEELRFTSDESLNWYYEFELENGLVLSGVPAIDSSINTTGLFISEFSLTHSSNSIRVAKLTINAFVAETSLPCQISFKKTFPIRPKPVVTSVSDISVCDGISIDIPFQSNVTGTNEFSWFNNNPGTGPTGIGLEGSGQGTIHFTSPLNPNSESEPRTGNIDVFTILAADVILGDLPAPACKSDTVHFEINVFDNPDQPIIFQDLPEPICINSTNLFLSLAPPANSFPTYTYDWQIDNLAEEEIDASGLFGVFSFNTQGQGNITVTRVSELSGCRSIPLIADFTVNGADASELATTEIFVTSNGNGLTCMNTGVDSYQWGMFNCENFTNTVFAENGNSQTFFPPQDLSEMIQSNVFWVQITDGECSSTIFYEEGCFAFIDTTTGLHEIKKHMLSNGLVIYPNPANGIFKLLPAGDLPGNTLISVYSIDGKLIRKINARNIGKDETIDLNLTDQSDGFYLLDYSNENGISGKMKLIKSTSAN